MHKKDLYKNYHQKFLESLGWKYFCGLQELDTEDPKVDPCPLFNPIFLVSCPTPSCNPPISVSKFVPNIYWIN